MPRQRTLNPVRPNVGIEAEYRRRLEAIIEELHRSLQRWVLAAYRRETPEMAQDDSPARALTAVMRRLFRRWQRRYDDLAPDLAKHFATTVAKRSDAALQLALRRGGISVHFKMGRAANDVLQATVQENVSLIRSIAQQHLAQVEQMVMRSVQSGRDLAYLNDALQHQLGVSKRRARLIARDQNNKATAAIQRVRHTELGIAEAIWIHSGGGKHPRPSHVKAGRDRAKYSISEGWYDPDERKRIWPGELINCRCVARPVVIGFA